jgi:hypothetical protein
MGLYKSDPTLSSRNDKTQKSLNYIINNDEFLKSIHFIHTFYEQRKSQDDDNFFSRVQKAIVSLGYDYSNGILPLLQTIYCYETPITKETFLDLVNLFRVSYNKLFLITLMTTVEIEIFQKFSYIRASRNIFTTYK